MATATVVTSMKDEAPYILEWVAYHKSIGFDRLVVMANDCTDGTHEMLTRLHHMGEVSYYKNEVPLGAKPHSLALKKANATEEVKTADYVMVLDADEFLAIKNAPYDVRSLISKMEQSNASMMVIPWRIFGSSNNFSFEDRPVIDRFTASMDISGNPKSGVKTLFRRDDSLRLAIHFPKKVMKNGEGTAAEEEHLWIDPAGNHLDASKLTWNGGKNKIGRECAEIAHFMIKSLDEYILKIFRGDGLMNSSRHGIDYWSSADRNNSYDLKVNEIAPGFRKEYFRLMSDSKLLELHKISVTKRHDKLNEILKNDSANRLRELLKRSTQGSLTKEELAESRELVTALSPRKVAANVLEGSVPYSALLSITTTGLSDTSAIVKRLSASCRNNATMFWTSKSFEKRPITCLVEGLKRAQKSNRSYQVACRYYDNFTKSEPQKEWPLNEEINVIITRNPEYIYQGFGSYVASSPAKYLNKSQRGFPPLKSVLFGEENLEDVLSLISQGRIEDPCRRLARYTEAHPDAIILNIDDPVSVKHKLDKLVTGGPAAATIVRLIKAAIADESPSAPSQSDQGVISDIKSNACNSFRSLQKQKKLKVYWFRRGAGNATGNFGDELGPLLVSYLTGRSVEWADAEECDLVSIGSILSQVSKSATRSKRMNDLLVWGSGLIEEDINQLDPCLKPLAVRGKNTRDALGLRQDLLLGDPGILSNFLVGPSTKKYAWGIVPHFTHRRSAVIKEVAEANGCRLIDPTDPVVDVLQAISSCSAIVSSSLHGLIVADSYSIPCYWLDLKSHKSHDYKFSDYCSGINRNLFPKLGIDNLQFLTAREADLSPFKINETQVHMLSTSLTEVL